MIAKEVTSKPVRTSIIAAVYVVWKPTASLFTYYIDKPRELLPMPQANCFKKLKTKSPQALDALQGFNAL